MATKKIKDLDKIIRKHQHWLKHDRKGWETMRANLSGVCLAGVYLYGADLSGANMSGANMSGANLRGANLHGANLAEADLRWADLSGADLSGAKLSEANLREANLSGVNLAEANLHGADLRWAKLSEANLTSADLVNANLRKAELYGANLHETNMEYADIYTASFDKKEEIRKGIILTKPMKGYKKTAEGVIITAEIPAGAIVFSINGKKCRTIMATILDTAGHKLLHSQYDPGFTYKIGKKIIIPNFDIRYNIECGPGFHFFRTKKEAKDY